MKHNVRALIATCAVALSVPLTTLPAVAGGGAGPANSSLEGLRALPGISNCPVVIEFG